MFWCWSCIAEQVESALMLCSKCLKAEAARHRRWQEGKARPTSDKTHDRHRADLSELDRPRTGKRPQHKPEGDF